MSSQPRFIHLRTHSEYSLLEGALRLKKLPGMCADMGMPAVALTDTNNMFAALEFSEYASGAGVQPIVGCQRPKAEALMRQLADTYPDRLYVELQRHPGEAGLPEPEELSEQGHVEMAYAMGLPLVATNDAYFPKPDMYEAHDALICIADGAYVDQQEGRRRLTPQHYFKTPPMRACKRAWP